jgi:hypothetical protein
VPYQREDINRDGYVDNLDVDICVNAILEYVVDSSVVHRADVNGDGAVNILDVQAIVNMYLGVK